VERSRTGAAAIALWAAILLAVFLIAWYATSAAKLYPSSIFPPPSEVQQAWVERVQRGRYFDDVVASLYRVTLGYLLALALSLPLGLWLGNNLRALALGHTRRTSPSLWLAGAVLPYVNFFRYISPLAWVGFAGIWFGTNDPPAIFLIFLSSFFPLVLGIAAAVANIPAVYYRVASDYGMRGVKLLTGVTLPAIMPQFITTLRVTMGIAWMVVVAAEMLSGVEGLGFAIWEARNGLRTDLMIVAMVTIGVIGIIIDQLMARLTRMEWVRWGYER
jgi:NitT/TauT family transport system permease protein